MTLDKANKGQAMRIKGINADPYTKKRLQSLGIVSNEEITLLGTSNGAVILLVKDSRLALGSSVVELIEVESI